MPDPTAIRLASEARRADLADDLYNLSVDARDLVDKAYQDERAALLVAIDLLAKAGADQGADLDGLRDRYTTLDAENAALEAERDDLRVRLGSAEHKLAAAESESHRVAVAAAEVTAERDALDARVAALEAVVKAAASTLHVYVGEDFEACRVCGIEDAKADHVDLDAYARGRDAADPVTVPAPDRAEELIIAQYDGCRKVAAELGHDGNWYAWGEWVKVHPRARHIQVESMRRALASLATPSPRFVAVPRAEVNGRPASWFHTEAEAGRYVALCNDNPDLFGADDEIEGALESYTHAVVDTRPEGP